MLRDSHSVLATGCIQLVTVWLILTRLEPEYLSFGSRNGLPSYPPSAANSLSGLTSDR